MVSAMESFVRYTWYLEDFFPWICNLFVYDVVPFENYVGDTNIAHQGRKCFAVAPRISVVAFEEERHRQHSVVFREVIHSGHIAVYHLLRIDSGRETSEI